MSEVESLEDDHSAFKHEVIERWGQEAYERGDRWWRSLSAEERRCFKEEQNAIAGAFTSVYRDGFEPESAEVQAVVARQVEWLSATTHLNKEYLIGLADMYVDDPRFRAHYNKDEEGVAHLVRDGMKVYAERSFK